MEIGDELKAIREKLGLKIRTFAQRLDVPEGRYKNWEYGLSRAVPDDVLQRARQMSRGVVLVRENSSRYGDAKEAEGFAVTFAIRSWSSAAASLGEEDEDEFLQDAEPYEVPSAFLVGGIENAERHDVIRVRGNSLSPVVEPGNRVLIFGDQDPRRNTIVMAESPEGKVFLKVLRDRKGSWALESIHPNGRAFTDLSGWKLHGYAVAIIKDPDGLMPNILWPMGQPIKVPEIV